MKLWKNHLEQLLGQPPVLDAQPIERVFNTLPIETGVFWLTDSRNQSMHGKNTKHLDQMAYQLKRVKLAIWRRNFQKSAIRPFMVMYQASGFEVVSYLFRKKEI